MSKTTNNNNNNNNNGDIFEGPLPQMKRETTIESNVFIGDLVSSLEIPTMRYQESITMPFRHQKVTPYNSGPHPHDAATKTYVYPGPSYRGYTEPQAMTQPATVPLSRNYFISPIADEPRPNTGPLTRCITLSEIAEESQPVTVPLRRLVSSTVTPNIVESVYETAYVEPVVPVRPPPLGMTRGVTYWNPMGIRREDELKCRELTKQDGYNTPP
jgi:hypothetical protein